MDNSSEEIQETIEELPVDAETNDISLDEADTGDYADTVELELPNNGLKIKLSSCKYNVYFLADLASQLKELSNGSSKGHPDYAK